LIEEIEKYWKFTRNFFQMLRNYSFILVDWGQAGGFLANVAAFIDKVMGVKMTVIKFEKDGKKRRMHIPNVLDIEIEAIAGGDPNKESTITNPALYGAAGFDPVISQSTKYVYHDHGLEWDNSGKNAFYSHFSYGP